jgi:hypothetical protein
MQGLDFNLGIILSCYYIIMGVGYTIILMANKKQLTNNNLLAYDLLGYIALICIFILVYLCNMQYYQVSIKKFNNRLYISVHARVLCVAVWYSMLNCYFLRYVENNIMLETLWYITALTGIPALLMVGFYLINAVQVPAP